MPRLVSKLAAALAGWRSGKDFAFQFSVHAETLISKPRVLVVDIPTMSAGVQFCIRSSRRSVSAPSNPQNVQFLGLSVLVGDDSSRIMNRLVTTG